MLFEGTVMPQVFNLSCLQSTVTTIQLITLARIMGVNLSIIDLQPVPCYIIKLLSPLVVHILCLMMSYYFSSLLKTPEIMKLSCFSKRGWAYF